MSVAGKARKLSLKEERELLRFEMDSLSQTLPKSLSKKSEEGTESIFRAEAVLRAFCPCSAAAGGKEEEELEQLSQKVSELLSPLLVHSSLDAAVQHQARLLQGVLLYREKQRRESLQYLSDLFLDLPPELSPGHQRLLADCYALTGLMHGKEHRRMYYYSKCLQATAQAVSGYQGLRDQRARSSSHSFKQPRPLDALFLPELEGIPELLAQSVLSHPEDLLPSLSSLRQVMISTARLSARGVRLRSAVSLARILLLLFSSRTEAPAWSESYESSRGLSCSYEDRPVRFEPSSSQEEATLLLKIAADGVELDAGFRLETGESGPQLRGETETAKIRPDFIDAATHNFCQEASQHSLALQVYSLLSLSLPQQPQSLVQPFQHGLRRQFFSQELVWLQYAEVLVANERHELALRALDTLLSHRPGLLPARLLAAKLSLDWTGYLGQCLRHADALKTCGHILLAAKGFAIAGLATGKLALRESDAEKKPELIKSAARLLRTAVGMDPSCPEFRLHLSALLAWDGDLTGASSEAQTAVSMDLCDHRASLLLTLILTAQGQTERASALSERLLLEFPWELELLQLNARLRLKCGGPEKALSACKRCLSLWQSRYGHILQTDVLSNFSSLNLNGLNPSVTSSEGSRPDSSAENPTRADSYRESLLSSGEGPAPGGLRGGREVEEAVSSLVSVWRLTGEVFMSAGRRNDALMSFREAATVRQGRSAPLLCCVGEVELSAGNKNGAKVLFESALAIDPQHAASLENLGSLLLGEGQSGQAEHYLRLSVRAEERPVALRLLGLIHQKRGEFEKSVELLRRSLSLQTSQPILPFYIFLDKPLL